MAGHKDNTQKVPPHYCSIEFVSCSFGITGQTLYNWTKEGCPRNKDGTYSLPNVYKWIMSRLKIKYQGGDIENLRRKKEIEYKEAQIQKIRGNLIEK